MNIKVGWLQTGEKDNELLREAVKDLDRGSRDQLGMLSVQIGFRQHLFPGVISDHTHLRYFFFMYYMLRDISEREESEILRKWGEDGYISAWERAETNLREKLQDWWSDDYDGDPQNVTKTGIIGTDNKERFAHSVYFGHLDTWGFTSFDQGFRGIMSAFERLDTRFEQEEENTKTDPEAKKLRGQIKFRDGALNDSYSSFIDNLTDTGTIGFGLRDEEQNFVKTELFQREDDNNFLDHLFHNIDDDRIGSRLYRHKEFENRMVFLESQGNGRFELEFIQYFNRLMAIAYNIFENLVDKKYEIVDSTGDRWEEIWSGIEEFFDNIDEELEEFNDIPDMIEENTELDVNVRNDVDAKLRKFPDKLGDFYYSEARGLSPEPDIWEEYWIDFFEEWEESAKGRDYQCKLQQDDTVDGPELTEPGRKFMYGWNSGIVHNFLWSILDFDNPSGGQKERDE